MVALREVTVVSMCVTLSALGSDNANLVFLMKSCPLSLEQNGKIVNILKKLFSDIVNALSQLSLFSLENENCFSRRWLPLTCWLRILWRCCEF